MLDVEAFSKKEIWQAKKLLYESDGNTKKSFIFNLAALVKYVHYLDFITHATFLQCDGFRR